MEIRESVAVGTGAGTGREISLPTAGPPPWYVYEVAPTIVSGFQTIEWFSPTRWRFRLERLY